MIMFCFVILYGTCLQKWKPLVGKTRLGAGYSDTCHNYMSVENRELWTHIRLNYYPDGGVARLRIFGTIKRTLQDILSTSADLVSKHFYCFSKAFSSKGFSDSTMSIITYVLCPSEK